MLFKGVRVYNPHRPRTALYGRGGKVHPRPNMTLKQRNNDSVLSILQPNEVVIPVRYFQRKKKRWINLAKKVERDLEKEGIHLPGF